MRKTILLILAFCVVCVFAQAPSTGDYTLIFSTFSNGGTELPSQRTSARFRLSDVVGRGTSAADVVLSGTHYDLYGGFRNVDLDLRAPFAWLSTDAFLQPSPIFPVNWWAADTTIEDGEGWGIWKYDVQWMKESDGVWYDWHTETELTFSSFGPTDPDEVEEGEKYYFRVRAHDLVGNVHPWSEPIAGDIADSAMFNPPVVAFSVLQSTGEDYWIPTQADGVTPDTLLIGGRATMRTGENFIIKNLSEDEAIDVGLYAHHAPPWQLTEDPGLDQYALRAIMNDEENPPHDIDFQSLDNVIKAGLANIRWAEPGAFGDGGMNIAVATADSVLRTENLWLQLQAPTTVSRFQEHDNVEVMIRVQARNTIY